MLQRTGADCEIELPVTVTPVGAVSRLEHGLSNFDSERDNYRHRLADAHRRLASYQPRLGEDFALEAELELKLLELAEIEKDLAATEDAESDGQMEDTIRVAA
jgi:hypothetical protein